MRFWLKGLALGMVVLVAAWSNAQEAPLNEDASVVDESALDEQEQYRQWAQQVWEGLNRQTGEIAIASAGAVLNVPESFYYLGAEDAETVLVDVWGNPPGQNVLGMLFPAGLTPFDSESWAVTIEYEEDGYVSDDDAHDIDYSDLLKQMQKDTNAGNKERASMGYEPITLVGWAATPFYDASTHKLHWAKELRFGDIEPHTLNYNIRVLGRKGVLVLNFIAGMDQQALIESQIDSVIAMANFKEGARYADFNPDIDEVAAYGLGALVAGKVLAKTGVFAMILIFLKKFGVFILVAVGAFLKNFFSRRSNQ